MRRQTLHNVTDEYRREGHPDPLSGRDAERAARRHFANTPASAASWRGWAYIRMPGYRNQQIVAVQISRKAGHRVDYLGAVPTKRTRDLTPADRVYIPDNRAPLTVVDTKPWRRNQRVIGLKPEQGGVYSCHAATDMLWVMAA